MISAVVSMRYGHTSDTCLVFLVDAQPFGACKTFFEAMMMVNNAFKVGGLERVTGGLKWPHLSSGRTNWGRAGSIAEVG